MTHSPYLVAIEPVQVQEYAAAVTDGGGKVEQLGPDVFGLVWTEHHAPDRLAEVLERNPQIKWVQLPFAGVENFHSVFEWSASRGRSIVFTSAKGAYREPVAEHALMLALALARAIPERVKANTWGSKFAASLFDSNVIIVGGGGIAEELIRLLTPFRARISVVLNHVRPMPGTAAVQDLSALDVLLPKADFVFLAAALTVETKNLFDVERFCLMKPSAYLINVARGGIVNSADLEFALKNGLIAGAGVDVTNPEPLPDGHPLWTTPNLIITPHTADTPEICLGLLSTRIKANVQALVSGNALDGQVNLELGY